MLQEKQNSALSQKMADLSGVTGEPAFDKMAAWVKLEQRLDKRSSPVKPYWYWVAASLILTAVLPFLITKETTTGDKIIGKAAAANNDFIVQTVINKPGEVKPAIDAALFTEEKKVNAPAKKNEIIQQDLIAIFHPQPLIPDTIPQMAPLQDPVLAFTPAPDSASVAPVVAKVKMRVVHINELADEDKTVFQNMAKIKAAKTSKKIPGEEFARTLRFRIYLKN